MMLATKKWETLPPRAGRPAGGPDTAASSGRDRFIRWSGGFLVVAFLLCGCQPPGRRELLQGQRLIREGRPAEAVEPLLMATRLFATNAVAAAYAWNQLGLAYHYTGQLTEASQAYQNALAKDFNCFEARYNRGCLFLQQNSLSAAINEFNTYVTHRPGDPYGWLKLGSAQLRARSYEAAERTLQRTVDFSAGATFAAQAWNALGVCQAHRRRAQEAQRSFASALRYQTNFAPALLNQAILRHQNEDYAQAIAGYKAYLALLPNAPSARAVTAVLARLELDRGAPPAPVPTNPPVSLVLTTAPPSSPSIETTPVPPPRATGTTATAALASATIATNRPAIGNRAVTSVTASATAGTGLVTAPLLRPALPTNSPVTEPLRTSLTARPVVPEGTPAAAATTNETATRTPVEPPPPPLETVQLTADPEPVLAKDMTAPTTSAASTSRPPPLITTLAQPTPTAAPTPTPAAAPPAQAGTKPSLFQRLNPLRLVGLSGSSEPSKPPVTPIPTGSRPPEAPAATAPIATISPPPAVATPAPAPRPEYPRFKYVRPVKPTPGDTTRAALLIAEAFQRQRAGEARQAVQIYDQARQADPASFAACYNLGVAAFDLGDWPLALDAYEQALANRPDDANARLNFALTLERAGFPIDAADELDTLLELQSTNVEAHLALANLQSEVLEDRAKARAHYERVIELEPRHPQAPAIRRWLAANRKPD